MGAEGLLPDDETNILMLPPSCLRRHIAILLAGHASKYIANLHGGVAGLFKLMLSGPGETWHTFRVVDGEFPSDEDLLVYDAFVVTGSKHDAHGSEPWVLQLCEVIKKAYLLERKLLGICFGHQIICRALGGKTGRAVHGWELGITKVDIADAMHAKPYALKLPTSLSIIELHQDEVYELPPGGEVLASSQCTRVEMFGIRNQVLGIQGHPEFQEDMALDLLDNYLRVWCTNVTEGMVDEAKLRLNQVKADQKILHQMCKSFLQSSSHHLYQPALQIEEEIALSNHFLLQERIVMPLYDSFDCDMLDL